MLTSFLTHHVLLGTVIRDFINDNVCRMMLTEWRLFPPEQCVSLFSIFLHWLLKQNISLNCGSQNAMLRLTQLHQVSVFNMYCR